MTMFIYIVFVHKFLPEASLKFLSFSFVLLERGRGGRGATSLASAPLIVLATKLTLKTKNN